MIFAVTLDKERKPDGRLDLNFRYRRYHLTLEDAKHSVLVLNEAVKEELMKLAYGDDRTLNAS